MYMLMLYIHCAVSPGSFPTLRHARFYCIKLYNRKRMSSLKSALHNKKIVIGGLLCMQVPDQPMETNESQDSGIQSLIPVVDVANSQSDPFGERLETNESRIQGLIPVVDVANPQSYPFGERMQTNESQDSGIQSLIPVVDVANSQSDPFGERMQTNESQDSGIQGLIHCG